jgi:hypothetical protein
MRRKKASPSMRGARPKLKPNPLSENNKNMKREGRAFFLVLSTPPMMKRNMRSIS